MIFETNIVGPDIKSLIVGVIDSDPQAVFFQAIVFCQQFPGVEYGVFFEVVTKAEIPQHFKKGVMPRGVTHLVQVIVFTTGTHALLRTGCPRIAALFRAQEHILELGHARIGKKQCGVVCRNQ